MLSYFYLISLANIWGHSIPMDSILRTEFDQSILLFWQENNHDTMTCGKTICTIISTYIPVINEMSIKHGKKIKTEFNNTYSPSLKIGGEVRSFIGKLLI